MASALPSTTEKRKPDNLNGNQAKKSHWSAGLSIAMEDESVQVYKDDLCTVIRDKFPKVHSLLSVYSSQRSLSFRLVFIYSLCRMNLSLI